MPVKLNKLLVHILDDHNKPGGWTTYIGLQASSGV
jgi:hypothetical protein